MNEPRGVELMRYQRRLAIEALQPPMKRLPDVARFVEVWHAPLDSAEIEILEKAANDGDTAARALLEAARDEAV